MQANLFILLKRMCRIGRCPMEAKLDTDYIASPVAGASARCYPKMLMGWWIDSIATRPPKSGHEMASLCQSCVHVGSKYDMHDKLLFVASLAGLCETTATCSSSHGFTRLESHLDRSCYLLSLKPHDYLFLNYCCGRDISSKHCIYYQAFCLASYFFLIR